MKKTRESEKVVKKRLNKILDQLTELSEGYLNQEKFNGDPEASMKSFIDGLIDHVNEVLLTDVPDTYEKT